MPSPFRYHSLATSAYSLSAAGMSFGRTTIAPYMPFAMCASTGFVPQWYMKTPGSFASKRKVKDSPGEAVQGGGGVLLLVRPHSRRGFGRRGTRVVARLARVGPEQEREEADD